MAIKKCKQCATEFNATSNSKYCSSCSREAAVLHYRIDRHQGDPRPDGAGRGRLFYPRDYDRMKYGFSLMGIGRDDE